MTEYPLYDGYAVYMGEYGPFSPVLNSSPTVLRVVYVHITSPYHGPQGGVCTPLGYTRVVYVPPRLYPGGICCMCTIVVYAVCAPPWYMPPC